MHPIMTVPKTSLFHTVFPFIFPIFILIIVFVFKIYKYYLTTQKGNQK